MNKGRGFSDAVFNSSVKKKGKRIFVEPHRMLSLRKNGDQP